MSTIKLERVKRELKRQFDTGEKRLLYDDYGIRVEVTKDCFLAFGLTKKEKDELYNYCKPIIEQL